MINAKLLQIINETEQKLETELHVVRELIKIYMSRCETYTDKKSIENSLVDSNAIFSKKNSFSKNIKNVIQLLNSSEQFTASDIESILIKNNVNLPPKPREKIAVILLQLKKKCLLELSIKGRGSIPNKYIKKIMTKDNFLFENKFTQLIIEDKVETRIESEKN